MRLLQEGMSDALVWRGRYTVNYWMLQHSFSIGIGDTVADGQTMLVINQTINRVPPPPPPPLPLRNPLIFLCFQLWFMGDEIVTMTPGGTLRQGLLRPAQAKDEVKKLIAKAQANELEAQPGRTIMESFENQVTCAPPPRPPPLPLYYARITVRLSQSACRGGFFICVCCLAQVPLLQIALSILHSSVRHLHSGPHDPELGCICGVPCARGEATVGWAGHAGEPGAK